MDITTEDSTNSIPRTTLPYDEDTSDDEEEQKEDMALTYNNSNMERSFKFYEFGTEDEKNNNTIPFHEILTQLTEQKEKYHHQTRKHGSPKNNKKPMIKTFDIREYQKTMIQTDLTMSKTISRFHPKEAKWEGTKTPDEQMLKDIYRIPCRDPTGKMIFSLARDEAKGCKIWKKPEPDRDIPPPTFAQCSLTFQIQALKSMDEAIGKVEEEYHRLPSNSIAKSTYKSKVGADLNNLKLEREHIVQDIS